jgi:hypothetical protein
MPLEPTKHVNGRMWQPGQSGNPNGRPVGSRTVFSQAFLKDLAEVWSDEGREAMVKTAKTNPIVFFATCARLIPQDVKLTVEQSLPGNLSPHSNTADRGKPFATLSRMLPIGQPAPSLSMCCQRCGRRTLNCPEKDRS